MKYWLKECLRCRGDLRIESDIYGRYIECMQCGYILNVDEETKLMMEETLRETVTAARLAA